MPFHRFEEMESILITPHLSSARAPVIEGDYLYFCLNQKEAGTGSELHYHPNELLIFCLQGKINAVVGKDRRIITPGTFILVPPYARHSMRATEDGACAYLYIKDQTWTVVGIAADEGVPERALSIEQSAERHRQGSKGGNGKTKGESKAVIDGIRNCYYPMLSALDQPIGEGRRSYWIEGQRSAFGLFESQNGIDRAEDSTQEQFLYVLQGRMHASVGNEEREVGPGDIIQVPRGARHTLFAPKEIELRYVSAASLPHLEWLIDEGGGQQRGVA